MFSDLHVSAKTLDVCLEVLREVRDAARLRGAGVLFLGMSLAIERLELTHKDAGMIRPAVYVAVWHSGDFWHVKGPLAVRPLNAILAELQTWTQPTVMLVGNHDQVLLSGLDHALPPLAAACRSMIMIDQPCIFMDALWLPYRRNVVELQAALKQAGSVTAVFAHADVVGPRHQPRCFFCYISLVHPANLQSVSMQLLSCLESAPSSRHHRCAAHRLNKVALHILKSLGKHRLAHSGTSATRHRRVCHPLHFLLAFPPTQDTIIFHIRFLTPTFTILALPIKVGPYCTPTFWLQGCKHCK